MASQYYLEFEKPMAELEKKIQELQRYVHRHHGSEDGDCQPGEEGREDAQEDIFANLTRWQTAQVARHINRPFTTGLPELIFTDFIELHGDRNFGDDHAIVAVWPGLTASR